MSGLMQAAPGAAPPSVGFPDDYPVAEAIVNGTKVILRPLKQPLYDTELIATPTTVTQVGFFQRAQNQTTAAGALVKTIAETNMTTSGQLPSPLHFSIFGFVFEVQPNVSAANFNQLYTASAFTFQFGGNRIYLQIPLQRIPGGVGPTGYASTTVGATTVGAVQNGVGVVSNVFGFTINRKALQIRPNEAFNANVQWPTAAPTLAATDFLGNVITTIRLRVYLVGIFYQSL